MLTASGGHVRLEKTKNKSQLFMVSSAVSFRLIFHWLDLLMDFYCRGIGVELEKKSAASIFDCLDWNVTRLFGMMQNNELQHICYFLYFLYIWKYCNDTQLTQISWNQNLSKKKGKKTLKNIKKWPWMAIPWLATSRPSDHVSQELSCKRTVIARRTF